MENLKDRHFILLRFTLLLTVLFAFASCQSQPSGESRQGVGTAENRRAVGPMGGTLRYRVAAPVKTFNYLAVSDEPSYIATFFLMGGRLVEFDHDRQTYVPALATAWEDVGDGKAFALTLRDDARFSDGRELTAEDVAFTLRAMYDERTASPLFRDLMMIGGKQITAQVKDAHHLQLTFPEAVAVPESYFSNIAVLPRHVLEEELRKGSLRDAYNITSDPQRIVTSGAFTVQSAVPGESVTLRRNAHYWKRDAAGNQLPNLESISVETITDKSNANVRINQGALDVVDRIRPSDYGSLPHGSEAAAAAVRAYDLGPGLNTDHLWFNLNTAQKINRSTVDSVKLAWFRDVRFRRAVSHAIDRDSMVATTLQGLATSLYGFISPGNRAWNAADLPQDAYDLDRARALLAEAGFTWRNPGEAPELYDAEGNRVEWTLIVPAENEARKNMAAIIQEDLGKVGMRVHIAPVESGELARRWSQSYDYDAVLYGTAVTEPDPSSYAGVLRSTGAQHFWAPKQEKPSDWELKIDALMTGISFAKNENLRRADFREVQRILAEQLPMIPIVARHLTVAATARLGNYRPSAVTPYSLWNVEEIFWKSDK
ncbi:MAG: ABC transporter substrate-binding protein [Pyrinomonadaceae bacterium]